MPDAYRVRLAPYALIRTTVAAYPEQDPAAAEFRSALAELTAVEAESAAGLPALLDALYASRAGHGEDFHREVVLPLRRDLHNAREPRHALLARLGPLPDRVPALAAWLGLRARRRAALARLAATAPAALAVERAALAELCRDPALCRAVALTSPDLLRAILRAGAEPSAGAAGQPGDAGDCGGQPDGDAAAGGARPAGKDRTRKARKEEAGVLRYALRATTRSSPLSWFTAVGWGRTAEPGTGRHPAREPELPYSALVPVVRVNRALVGALAEALLADPRRRARLPHRLSSSPRRLPDGRTSFSTTHPVLGTSRYLALAEDDVTLPTTGPLRLIVGSCERPALLAELTCALAERLASGGSAAAAHDAAEAFVRRLADVGVLVPVEVVDPQDPEPLASWARWLREDGGLPGDAALAARIEDVARATQDFGAAEPARRPALLAGLSASWHSLLTDAGRPVQDGAGPLSVLSEDVVAPDPVPLDGVLDDADRAALAEVAALAELFDMGHVLRRVVRDLFVARHGEGGVCDGVWEFGQEVAQAWEQAGRIAARLPGAEGELPSRVAELATLRREVRRATVEGPTDAGPGPVVSTGRAVDPDQAADANPAADPGQAADAVANPRPAGDPRLAADPRPTAGRPAPEVVVPPDLVRGLGDRLPRWMLQRPAGYAYFVQRGTPGGLLCVNHVYGGWGRFTSRFLDALAPAAAEEVASRIREGLGPAARPVQIRPVSGFNANLHPLLAPDDIGPDRRWTSLAEHDVDLVHDVPSDQIRVRLRATGALLDVLYPGFLAPVMLPQRLAPLLCDHPLGVVDFRALLPPTTLDTPGGPVVHTPRLRHRHLVLARRRWRLPAAAVAALRTDLTADAARAADAARTVGAHRAADAGADVPAAAVARWRSLLDLPEQLFLHPAPVAPTGVAVQDFMATNVRPKPRFLDLGNALHLRLLPRVLARHPAGLVIEEALPAPAARPRPTRAAELVLESCRAAAPPRPSETAAVESP